MEMFTTTIDCCRIMDMPITMLGQVFNSLFYYRHRNTLMTIMDDKKKVKNMMWEDKDIIQESTSKRLFGEKFDQKITEHVKVRKKSRKFFKIIDNKQPNNSINNVNDHQPFRRSPLPQQDVGGGQSNFFSYHQNHNRSGNRTCKSKFKSSFLRIPSSYQCKNIQRYII